MRSAHAARLRRCPLHPEPAVLQTSASLSRTWGITRQGPCALHHQPYTLNPAPCTLHPAPYTLHPSSYTLHLSPLQTWMQVGRTCIRSADAASLRSLAKGTPASFATCTPNVSGGVTVEPHSYETAPPKDTKV